MTVQANASLLLKSKKNGVVRWPPMQRADSLENTLMLGKIEDRRRKGQQRMRCLYGFTDSMNYEFEQTLGDMKDRKPVLLQSMGSQRVRHDLVIEQLFMTMDIGIHHSQSLINVFEDKWVIQAQPLLLHGLYMYQHILSIYLSCIYK